MQVGICFERPHIEWAIRGDLCIVEEGGNILGLSFRGVFGGGLGWFRKRVGVLLGVGLPLGVTVGVLILGLPWVSPGVPFGLTPF